MKRLLLSLSIAGLVFGMQSCNNDDDSPNSQTQVQEVKENYADIVLAGYEDSHAKAVELKEAIDAFVANPTAQGMENAKQAWYDAREPYGQTEAFRFSEDGPIDTGENAVEGMINAWPLDESMLDYVNFNEESNLNIINNVEDFPNLTEEVLRGNNESGEGERGVTMGYHAIEFLLWGQDSQVPTPGAEHTTGGSRPYTDYMDGGTASNQDRRRQYLQLVTELLLDDLAYLVDEWDTNGNNYRTQFLASADDFALRNMIKGMGELVGSELANERIFVAVEQESQEDEHSCFSDNTHRDVLLNFIGVKNVYTGSYTRVDGSVVSGPSIHDLLLEEDADRANDIMEDLEEIENDIRSTTIPFDYSITLPTDIIIWNDVVVEMRALGDEYGVVASILAGGTL